MNKKNTGFFSFFKKYTEETLNLEAEILVDERNIKSGASWEIEPLRQKIAIGKRLKSETVLLTNESEINKQI